jgi:twitching motility protein PilT
MILNEILKESIQNQASDVHLKVGIAPIVRIHGKLRQLSPNRTPFTIEDLEQIANTILDPEQRRIFDRDKEIDIGHSVSGLGRFRVNFFRQRGTIRIVIRIISVNPPTLQQLSLPPVIEKIAGFERGLILVTGITGSGKSSTLAAIIDHINNHKNKHILTIEDPIEFLIRDRKSLISQRELGHDTTTMAKALRAGLRQDPDIILIGEMRDQETMEIALTAAETGHLVLSTLHTSDARETINRILAQFEAHQHGQIRRQLASVLKAVVSQRLARRKDKSGFVPAVEVLISNQRIKEMIENPERTGELHRAIEDGHTTMQMQTFDQSLMSLLMNDLIDYPEALRLSSNPDDFQLRVSGIATGGDQWNPNTQLNERERKEWSAAKTSDLEIETNLKRKYSDDHDE